MIKDLPYYRLNKGQIISLREVFKLEDFEDIDKIIITIHDDNPEGKVKCTIVGDEEGTIIDNQHAFFYGYGRHNLTSFRLNVRTEKVECIVEALEDSVISIGITLL